jgi:hypothetical protein
MRSSEVRQRDARPVGRRKKLREAWLGRRPGSLEPAPEGRP